MLWPMSFMKSENTYLFLIVKNKNTIKNNKL